MFRPKVDRQAVDKNYRKQLKEFDEFMKVPKAFQTHSLTQRLVSALVPIPTDPRSQKKEAPTAFGDQLAVLGAGLSAAMRGGSRNFDEKIRQELEIIGVNVPPESSGIYELSNRRDDIVSARIRTAQEEYLPLAEESIEAREHLRANASSVLVYSDVLHRLESSEKDLLQVWKKVQSGRKVGDDTITDTMSRLSSVQSELSSLPPIGQTGTNYQSLGIVMGGTPRTTVGFLLPSS
jgi:hypothetical protein